MYILENVSKKYHRRNKEIFALEDINLEIEDGDFLIIKGESGSGKSTLLALLAGIQEASLGKVFLDGNDFSSLSENDIAKLLKNQISYIPQGYSLLPNLSILDNIRLVKDIKNENQEKTQKNNRNNKINNNLANNEVKEIIRILKELKISDLIRSYPEELSGGEQKRVAIARALLQDTNIILADEPTSDLDKESANIIWSIFEKANQEGKTVIVVTHQEKLNTKNKRILVLEDGKIKKEEMPE